MPFGRCCCLIHIFVTVTYTTHALQWLVALRQINCKKFTKGSTKVDAHGVERPQCLWLCWISATVSALMSGPQPPDQFLDTVGHQCHTSLPRLYSETGRPKGGDP